MTDTSIPHTNTDGSATQFIWAMQRLAQMQGGSLDLLQFGQFGFVFASPSISSIAQSECAIGFALTETAEIP